jgi:transcriptional regulator with XRE-family HTH domain
MPSTENLTNVNRSFAGRLLGKLKEKGLSQDGLRELLGSNSTGLVSNWIKRDRPPKAEMLLRVAQILGTTPQWLLHGDGQEAGNETKTDEVTNLRERVRTLENQLRAIQQIAGSKGAAELTEVASASYDQKRKQGSGEKKVVVHPSIQKALDEQAEHDSKSAKSSREGKR